MASYDRMVGRSGGHTADGLGSTRSSGADKFNEAMKGRAGRAGGSFMKAELLIVCIDYF